tara:strand:- start:1701 stop:1895 length:195 start_codon:yes stop_codon:yes gene_type:complete
MASSTEFIIDFRSPVLPYAPQEYVASDVDRLNNILRLYFNQLDEGLQGAVTAHNSSEALTWFMS